MPEREPRNEQEYQKRERTFGEAKVQYQALTRKLHEQTETVRNDLNTRLQNIENLITQLAEAEGNVLLGDPAARVEVDRLKQITDQALQEFQNAVRTVEETPEEGEEVRREYGDWVVFLTDREDLFRKLNAFIDGTATDAEDRQRAQEIRQRLLAVGITLQDRDARLQELRTTNPGATENEALQQIGNVKRGEVQAIRSDFRAIERARGVRARETAREKKGERVRRELERAIAGDILQAPELKRRLGDRLSQFLDRALDELATGKKKAVSEQEFEEHALAMAWQILDFRGVPPRTVAEIADRVNRGVMQQADADRFQKYHELSQDILAVAQEQLFEEAEARIRQSRPQVGWKEGIKTGLKKGAGYIAAGALGSLFAGPLGGIGAVAVVRAWDTGRAMKDDAERRRVAQAAVVAAYRENVEVRRALEKTVLDGLVAGQEERARDENVQINLWNQAGPVSLEQARSIIAQTKDPALRQQLTEDYQHAFVTAPPGGGRSRVREIQAAILHHLRQEGVSDREALPMLHAAEALYLMNQMNKLTEHEAALHLQEGGATTGQKVLGKTARGVERFTRWRVDSRMRNAATLTALGVIGYSVPGLRRVAMGLGFAEIGAAIADRRMEGGAPATAEAHQQKLTTLLNGLRMMHDPRELEGRLREVAQTLGEVRGYLQTDRAKKELRAHALRHTLHQAENMVAALSAMRTGDETFRTLLEGSREKLSEQVSRQQKQLYKRLGARVVGFGVGVGVGVLSAEGAHWVLEKVFGGETPHVEEPVAPVVAAAAGAESEPAAPEPPPQPERGSFPEEAQHERPELLRRERTGDVVPKAAEQWLGTKQGEPLHLNVEGGEGDVDLARSPEAKEFMDRFGLRVDERQGRIVLKGRNDIFFALDENRDGTIDATQMKIDLVTRNFGSGEHKYLQIELVDHQDDHGTANLQRFFVEAEGKRAGEYLAKFEGDGRHEDASPEIRRLSEQGTVTARADVNGDNVEDEITKLNIHKYDKGGEEFWVESHAGARGADGTEYQLDIDDADSDGDIDVQDVESGMYDVTAVADDGTATSVGTYDAAGDATFSYEEIAAGKEAILDDSDSDFTSTDPDERVDAMKDAIVELNGAPDKFGYKDGSLAFWDGKHVQTADFTLEGATVEESNGALRITWNDSGGTARTETGDLTYNAGTWEVNGKTLDEFRGETLTKMFEGKYPFMIEHPDAAGLLLDRAGQELAMKGGVEGLTPAEVTAFFEKAPGALDPILDACKENGAFVQERLEYAIANSSENADAFDRLFERTEGIEEKLGVALSYDGVKQSFNPAHLTGDAPAIRLDRGDGQMIATFGSGTDRHSYLFTGSTVQAVDANDLAHPGPAVAFDANNLTDPNKLQAALNVAQEQFTEARAAEHYVLERVDDRVEGLPWQDFGKDTHIEKVQRDTILLTLRGSGILDENNVMRADFLQRYPDGMTLSVKELLHLSLIERPGVPGEILDAGADGAVAKDLLDAGVGKGWLGFERDLPSSAVGPIENMTVVDFRRMNPAQFAEAIAREGGLGKGMHDNLEKVHAFLETKGLPTQGELNAMPEAKRNALHIGDLLHGEARDALFTDVPAPEVLESHDFATFDEASKTFTLSTPEGLRQASVVLPESVNSVTSVDAGGSRLVTLKGEGWELVGTMKPLTDGRDILFTGAATLPGAASETFSDQSVATVVKKAADAVRTAVAAGTYTP